MAAAISPILARVPVTVREHPDGVTITVRAKPRASKNRVVGIRDGALEVAVAAAPVDGAANLELVRTLAAYFGLKAGQVSIVQGATGKNKTVCLAGAELGTVLSRLSALEGAAGS
jgi:uncharacterized protein (TIGR00251 family)